MKETQDQVVLGCQSPRTRKSLERAERLDRDGQWDKAITAYGEVLEQAKRCGDQWAQAHAMRKVGEIRRRRGDTLNALRMFHSSQNLFRRIGDRKSLSYLYNNIGLVHFGRGKWRLVKRYFGRALRIARAEGERKLEGQIFNNLGIMSQIQGQEARAIRYFEKALPYYEEVAFGRGIAQTHNNIGMCYRDRQMWDKARAYYEKSYRKSKELNDSGLMAIASLNIAMVMTHLHRSDRAKDFCDEAFAIFKRLSDKLGIGESYICYGTICRERNQRDLAEKYFKKSIELNRAIANNLGLAEAYRELALLYQDMGKGKLVLRFLGESFKIFRLLQASRYVDDIDDKIRELEEIYFRITREMGEEVESKDTYTYGHCQRVAYYSLILAEELGLSEQENKALLVAAFLHDLGKVMIPKEILKKPRKLSPDEYLMIMKHPAWGVDMLESVEFPWEVKPSILHHQEHYDGKGYPDGLEGEGIPQSARIISIADFFDALTTDRPYRKAMNLDETFSVMNREKGKALDPNLFALFERTIRTRFPLGKTVMTDVRYEDFLKAWSRQCTAGRDRGDKVSRRGQNAKCAFI